jgi:hypothetical protein
VGQEERDRIAIVLFLRQPLQGQAEIMIGVLKTRNRGASSTRSTYSNEETCMLLQESSDKNGRPISSWQWAETESLCPADFLMGRASSGVLSANFETGKQLVKRL